MCPSGSFKQVEVKCPFYKYDDGRRRITCEGLVDKSSIALIYLTRGGYDQQIDSFCCERYQQCPLYKMLMKKYEETSDGK